MSWKADRYMPLWTGDYQRSTTHLSAEQSGAYLHLLMAYWDRRGPLDDDDRQLALIARSTPKAWRKLRPVIAKFFTIEGGLWTHRRVEKELADASEVMERASKRGEIAARKRWSKQPENVPAEKEEPQNSAISECETQCTRIAQALLEQCSSPSPSPSKEDSKAYALATPERGGGIAQGVFEIWGRGVEVLTRSGVPERRARTLIGRWIRAHDSPAVIDALLRAEAQAAAEPVAFIEGILTHGHRAKAPRRGDPEFVGGIAGHLVAYFAERDGVAVERGGRDGDDRGFAGALPAA